MTLDVLAILCEHIHRDNYILTILYLFQIFQPRNHPVGQGVVTKHFIPVVIDRNSSRHHPSVSGVLVPHTVHTNGNAGQSFAAALFPLEEMILLLKNKIDVGFLPVVKMNFFLVLKIVHHERIQKLCNFRVGRHLFKGHSLDMVLPLFTTNDASKFTKILRNFTLGDKAVNRARILQFLKNGQHLPAVRLKDDFVISLYHFYHLCGRFGMLRANCATKISQNLSFRNTDLCPFFVLHILRHDLVLKSVKIFLTLGILIPDFRIALDLIEQLLYLIVKIAVVPRMKRKFCTTTIPLHTLFCGSHYVLTNSIQETICVFQSNHREAVGFC